MRLPGVDAEAAHCSFPGPLEDEPRRHKVERCLSESHAGHVRHCPLEKFIEIVRQRLEGRSLQLRGDIALQRWREASRTSPTPWLQSHFPMVEKRAPVNAQNLSDQDPSVG